MYKLILTSILSLIVGVIISFGLTYKRTMTLSNQIISFDEVYQINELIDQVYFISAMKEGDIYTEKHKKWADINIINALNLLAIYNPDVSSYPALQKEALCDLISYSETEGFYTFDLGEMEKNAYDYLKGIKPIVMASIKKSQSFFGGSGCRIRGQQGIAELLQKKSE